MGTISRKHGPHKPSHCLPPCGCLWVTPLDSTGSGRVDIANHRGDSHYYIAQVLDSTDSAIRSAVRLERVDTGTVYVVHQDWSGHWVCECPDFLYRREWQDQRGCKHCQAMSEAERVHGPILPLPRPQTPAAPKPQPRPAAEFPEGEHCPHCGDDSRGTCECEEAARRQREEQHEIDMANLPEVDWGDEEPWSDDDEILLGPVYPDPLPPAA